mmetsp:Transcript_4306/g.12221  ORF Transcript_4306/g.12221 Transcript_4306/m.12221 type:complete len:272 (+) Transcript_4306:226-1041(+)
MGLQGLNFVCGPPCGSVRLGCCVGKFSRPIRFGNGYCPVLGCVRVRLHPQPLQRHAVHLRPHVLDVGHVGRVHTVVGALRKHRLDRRLWLGPNSPRRGLRNGTKVLNGARTTHGLRHTVECVVCCPHALLVGARSLGEAVVLIDASTLIGACGNLTEDFLVLATHGTAHHPPCSDCGSIGRTRNVNPGPLTGGAHVSVGLLNPHACRLLQTGLPGHGWRVGARVLLCRSMPKQQAARAQGTCHNQDQALDTRPHGTESARGAPARTSTTLH